MISPDRKAASLSRRAARTGTVTTEEEVTVRDRAEMTTEDATIRIPSLKARTRTASVITRTDSRVTARTATRTAIIERTARTVITATGITSLTASRIRAARRSSSITPRTPEGISVPESTAKRLPRMSRRLRPSMTSEAITQE